jgi:F-type H+-transporting ATPase subunit c
MTKRVMMILVSVIASPTIFAQTSGNSNSNSYLVPVASVIAMAIASGLAALAQGKAVVGAAEGLARNPGAAAAIRFALLLGLVLIESLALYTLVVAFTILYKK